MSELKPLNPTEQDALVKQIGLALMRAAPEEWRHVTAEYRATGRYFELAAEVRSADGAARPWSPPHEVAGLFSRLRAGMYREGRGSWSNARYQLDHPSSYNLDFDRAEPSWSTSPPLQAYQDEMRFFPRTDDNVPDWLRRRLQPASQQQPLREQPPREQPLRAFRTARVFDGAGPGGRPSVNRPPVAEADRDLLLSYLDRAPVAVVGRGFDADVLNPDAPAVVPVAFQTDGHWIWPAAVGYYLRVYGVPPEPELVERAKALDFVRPDVSEEARVAAAANLGAPAAPQGTALPVAEPVEAPVEVGATVAAPLPDRVADVAPESAEESDSTVDVEETANLADLKPEVIEYAQEGPPYRVRFDEDGPVIDDRYRRDSYADGMDLFAPAAYERELNDTQTWNPFSEDEPDTEPAEETAEVEAVTAGPAHEEPAPEQPVYEQPVYEQPVYEQPADQEPRPGEEPADEADSPHSATEAEVAEAEVTAEFEVGQGPLYAPERTESHFTEHDQHAEPHYTESHHAEPHQTEPHHAGPHHTEPQFSERDDEQFAEPENARFESQFAEPNRSQFGDHAEQGFLERDEAGFDARTDARTDERADPRFEEHAEQAFGDPDQPPFGEPDQSRFEAPNGHQRDDHERAEQRSESRFDDRAEHVERDDQHFVEQVPPPFADQATQFAASVELFDDVDPVPPPPPPLAPAPVPPPKPVEQRMVTPDEERELSGIRRALDELDVPPAAYRFGEPADRTWLLRTEGQDWEVSWFDHGPTNPVRFDRLEDAAAYLTGKLVLTNRRAPRPAPMPPPPPQQRPRPPMNNGFREEPPRRPAPPQRPPIEPPAPAAAPVQSAGTATSTQEAKPQRSWPITPMNGEPPLTLFRHKQMVELPTGTEVDRFGEGEGNLVYVAGTPFSQRSLVPSWINRPYHVYRLRRPIEVLTGIAVPWFEQPGGGTAYLMPKTIDDMLADGVLVEVANQEAPAP